MTQPPAYSARGAAWTGIDADIDDHRRAVADKDWLGARRRNREAAPTAPAADKKLTPAKAVESKAIEALAEAAEAVEAEAVKPVRAETVEAKSARVKAPIEPVRREMGDMTHSEG